jgi:hypothetical protein
MAVIIGIWTNWSHGSVLGLTLTTTKPNGNLIISFLAIFIAFVAARLWKTICLALHRAYSTNEHRDTLHHQRQVVLRNSPSPGSGLLSFLRLLFAWRGLHLKSHLRLWPLILLSFICLIVFMVAGHISSAISTVFDDEVRRECVNTRNATSISEGNSRIIFEPFELSELLRDSSKYAANCYSTTEYSGLVNCKGFVTRSLPTKETNNRAKCPFEQKICRNANGNLRLDTGYIDSNDHIGLNAPVSERLAWRYVLHCAPLQTRGYTSHGLRG